jgi:hypothetical protein
LSLPAPPEQDCELHVVPSVLNPTQFKPPFEGVGLLQERDLVWVPPLQVAVHVDQEVQSPQFPSFS